MLDELIKALKEIAKLAAKDGANIWWPNFIKQSEINPEDDGYQKQPCESDLFEYEYCSQDGGGPSGDCFNGEMLYPFQGWFIHVQYSC